MNKYCTEVKLRASIGEIQSSHCQKIMPLPTRMTQNVPGAICIKDAERLFEKVL